MSFSVHPSKPGNKKKRTVKDELLNNEGTMMEKKDRASTKDYLKKRFLTSGDFPIRPG